MRGLRAGAAAGLALLAGCGAPDELSRQDAQKLATARERLGNAVETAETLRTSPREVRRIQAEVRRILADGSLEAEKLDEFGLAALGELQIVVPSVVETDADGVPKDLDRPALRAFLRYAGSDPARALLGPARNEVDAIDRTVENSDADEDTRLRDRTVGDYLDAAERDLRPIWPRLAERVGGIL